MARRAATGPLSPLDLGPLPATMARVPTRFGILALGVGTECNDACQKGLRTARCAASANISALPPARVRAGGVEDDI